ncbi:MAG: hypothetical protein ACHQHO_02810 [Solirubrobacterales bacterium]
MAIGLLITWFSNLPGAARRGRRDPGDALYSEDFGTLVWLVNATLKRLQRRPQREEAAAGWERW